MNSSSEIQHTQSFKSFKQRQFVNRYVQVNETKEVAATVNSSVKRNDVNEITEKI